MFGFIRKLLGGGSGRPMKASRFGVDELARRLGLTESALRSVVVSYTVFQISKRTGGVRKILAPTPPLKDLQRRILHWLLRGLRAHPCATGFERGHSIVTNARTHVGHEIVIKLDLKDFFGTTSSKRVQAYFQWIGWNSESAELLTRLCTNDGSLPQGAPTSPRLSNLLNHRLDARLQGLAAKYGMAYSRYADDMTFSGSERIPAELDGPHAITRGGEGGRPRVNGLIDHAKRVIENEGYSLHTKKKLRIARRHNRQVVTGLVVNEKVQLPRATRQRLRAIEHRLKTKGQASISAQQLAGWHALQKMIAAHA